MGKIPIIAIIGPTAVGKTQLSLELAEKLNAEIISVDSRQVYRYMDVGTDKVSAETRRRVLHHLIDVADPDEVYDAARFREEAQAAVGRIRKRGRIPLLAGGTMFYYQAFFGDMLSEGLPREEGVRSRLEERARDEGTIPLHAELAAVDPERAGQVHPNDLVRIVRALELFELTGVPPTRLYRERGKLGSSFFPLYIGLDRPRDQLFRRIEERVREQFHSGYPEEVEWLLKMGYDERSPSMQGFGYRELVDWVRGKVSFEEALDGDIRATKLFARRQITWFRKFEPVLWYDVASVGKDRILEEVYVSCLKHLEKTDR